MNVPTEMTTIPATPTTVNGEAAYRGQIAAQVVWMLVNGTRNTPETALDTWEKESNVELTNTQRKSIINRIEW